ncbi:hypothetical protein [Streptomyces sp. NPDC020571]
MDEDRAFAETLAALGHDDAHDEGDAGGEEVPLVWADRYFDYV